MLRALYNKTLELAGRKQAPAWLAGVSFAESSFFPIPPDVMLAPMVLARPERAWFYATICTIASVIGGVAGYGIGYFAAGLGEQILAVFGQKDGLEAYQKLYAEVGLWVILIKGATPIPYKLVTIASGLAAFSFPVFIAASVVTRGARFFLVAFLIKKFGPAIMPVVEKRLYTATALLIVLIVGGVLLANYIGH